MIQNTPTEIISYIDNKNNLITNQVINKIQINSEDELSLLTNYGIGTRAYLPDESATWIYGADAQWHKSVENSSSKIEPLIVHEINNNESIRLDKTWKEIYDAFISIGAVIERLVPSPNSSFTTISVINSLGVGEGFYDISITVGFPTLHYAADNENSYPYYVSTTS